ncbi:hypothetical protein E2C01_100781 [Portunus trituberculatus]|uniref:Uncharacterized protein n=1 Tax=Portunus trituberculatus TaxID=210409 RepID=A0A5B7KIS9_PORTR|nr:hypothetical protein [Portunus trituberculatus]
MRVHSPPGSTSGSQYPGLIVQLCPPSAALFTCHLILIPFLQPTF